MNGNSKAVSLVYFGVFAMALGGMFTVMHVGNMSRQDAGIQHGFSFRDGGDVPADSDPAARLEEGVFSDIKRGVSAIAGAGSDMADDLLSWLGGRSDSPSQARTAQLSASSPGDDSDAAFDPFEKFYSKYYAKGSRPEDAAYSAAPSVNSWSGAGGSTTASVRKSPESLSQDKGMNGSGAISLREAEAVRPVFGGPTGKTPSRSSASSLHASLPSRNGAGLPPALGGDNASAQTGSRDGSPAMKTRGLSGMNGGVAAGALDDAASGLRSGSQGDYGSAMGLSGTAAAAAGAAKANPPAVSSPQNVSTPSGGSSSSSSGSSSSSSAGTGSSSGDAKASSEKPVVKTVAADQTVAKSASFADDSFLGSVVTERNNRFEGKYLSQDDYGSAPEKTLLVAGAMPADSGEETAAATASARSSSGSEASDDDGFMMRAFKESGDGDDAASGDAPAVSQKRFSRSHSHSDSHAARKGRTPDPENFSELSERRQQRIRRHIHRFMRRFENKYGMMDDIRYTPCSEGNAICSKHNLTQGYITEATRLDAKLVIGLKYSHERWRPYTVSVTMPYGEDTSSVVSK